MSGIYGPFHCSRHAYIPILHAVKSKSTPFVCVGKDTKNIGTFHRFFGDIMFFLIFLPVEEKAMEESEDHGVKVKAWDIKTFERLFVSLYPGL